MSICHTYCLLIDLAVKESAQQIPFFLLYGWDVQIPTDSVLAYSHSPYAVDLKDYKEDLSTEMSIAWKLVSDIFKAQCTQERIYDRKSKEVDLEVVVTISFDRILCCRLH